MLEEAVATLFDDSVLLEMKLYIISGNHEKYVLLFNFECLGTVHKWCQARVVFISLVFIQMNKFYFIAI